MPASSSESRWRKRRREDRKCKGSEEDEILEEDANPNLGQNPRSDEIRDFNEAAEEEEEERISEFPLVIKRRHVSRGGDWWMSSLENISHGQLHSRSAIPVDTSAFVITPPRIMEGRGLAKPFAPNLTLLLPMHSDWFSPNAVHRLERQVVPHFFSAKSPNHTPDTYITCRNSILATYLENPDRHLSLSDCQGLAPGFSLDDMTRIMRFLDHWGIINYSAHTPTPTANPHNQPQLLYQDSNDELCVPSAALKSIDSLIKFDRPKCRRKASDVHSYQPSDFDATIREELSDSRCNHCSRPIAMEHYQSQKEVYTTYLPQLRQTNYNDFIFLSHHLLHYI